MKWCHLFVVLLLAVTWVQAEEKSVGLQDITKTLSAEDGFDIKKAIKAIVDEKCEEAGGKALVKKVSKALDNAKACVEEHAPKNVEELKEDIKDGSSSSEELCSDKRPKLRQCFSDFVDVVEECGDEEERYLPAFAFDALDSLLDYVCADDGAIIQKILDPKTLDCVMVLAEQENVTNLCEGKLEELFRLSDPDTRLTKSQLCMVLRLVKICSLYLVEKHCPEAESLKDMVQGFVLAVSSPCNIDPKDPYNLILRRRRFTLF